MSAHIWCQGCGCDVKHLVCTVEKRVVKRIDVERVKAFAAAFDLAMEDKAEVLVNWRKASRQLFAAIIEDLERP